MIITFNTQSETEIQEVVELLNSMGHSANATVPTPPKVEVTKADIAPVEEKPATAKEKPKKAKAKTTASTVTLADLKATAQEAVARTDRQKVKDAICQYAPKLNDVSEEDYEKLVETLKGM